MIIREATINDFENIWPLLEEVFSKGDTYTFDTNITKEEAKIEWMDKPNKTYIAIDDNEVLGTYFLKTNQQGPGSHVCNAGYIVSEKARGKGLGDKLCKHSLIEAKLLGYKAMQYNIVVSTNIGAIKLWQKNGFKIVGTLPKAYNHIELGYVDAFVMYKFLE